MARKFAGFKPTTMDEKILPALGYDGPRDQKSVNAFLASNPAAAAKMGKYTMFARQMIEGKPIAAPDTAINAAGGNLTQRLNKFKSLPANQRNAASHQAAIRGGGSLSGRKNKPAAAKSSGITSYSPPAPTGTGGGGAAQTATTPAATPDPNDPAAATTTTTNSKGGMPSGAALTSQITTDPTSIVSKAQTVADDGGPDTLVDPTAGQAAPAAQATATTATPAAAAQAAPTTPAAQVTASQSQGAVNQALAGSQAAQGTVSQGAQAQAAQANPAQASSLGLQAAQQQGAQQVQAPAPMQKTADQLILGGAGGGGSTVDMQKVDQTFGTGPIEAASVKDELDDLMQDFQGGATPAWAAGAMRNANAMMAARGIGASSMAGMAVVQAAMESALPIAQMDASNKQQMAMMKAEQRAKFMGMDFDQKFQAKVKNAARVSEIANINFSAEQQVALENARMAQTVDMANLSNRQAKVMADAATMSQMDMANLNNRQQAAMQQADAFLKVDMQNLNNEQQMSMFKAQEQVNSILSDTAAENAAKQFNATSQNQTDQFFASMATQVSQFNTEQGNAMARFNAGEANALEEFNTAQENARDQFNAQNSLVIAQANAQWAQSITTAENAANNQANRDAALAANNLTMTAYNNTIQRERDLLAWAWQSGENAAEQSNNIAIAKINANGKGSKILETAAGSFVGKLTSKAVDLLL